MMNYLSNEEKDQIVNMFKAILDNDEGVNEKAYDKMERFAEQLNYEPLNNLIKSVDATNGRYYILSDDIENDNRTNWN